MRLMTRPDMLASPTRAVVSMKTTREPVRRASRQKGTTRLAPDATTTAGRTVRRTRSARRRFGSTLTGLRPYSGSRSTCSPRRSRSSACGPGDVTQTRAPSRDGPTTVSRSRWPPGEPASTVTLRLATTSPGRAEVARQRGGVDTGLLLRRPVPGQLVEPLHGRGAQPLEERGVGVELAQVGGEGVDVAGGMDEAGDAVLAAGAGGVRDGEHAAAGLRLVRDERAALLDGRQDEHVALTHETGEVRDVPPDLNTGIREQRRDDLAVAGHELAADDEAPAPLARAGALPGVQGVVQALARLEPAGEQRRQRPADRPRRERRAEAGDVRAVLVDRDLRRGHAARKERRPRVLRLAEDHVDGGVLGLLVAQTPHVGRVAVAGR